MGAGASEAARRGPDVLESRARICADSALIWLVLRRAAFPVGSPSFKSAESSISITLPSSSSSPPSYLPMSVFDGRTVVPWTTDDADEIEEGLLELDADDVADEVEAMARSVGRLEVLLLVPALF